MKEKRYFLGAASEWADASDAGLFLVAGLLVCLALRPSALLADVPSPEFSPGRGFYDAPVLLTLETVWPDAGIVYTTDGSEPAEDHGQAYTQPILLTKTTCIRAATRDMSNGLSPIVTHTYIVRASDAIQSLPVLSLVGDPQDSFYMPYGICAIQGGTYSGDYVSWLPSRLGDYNHPMGHGLEFERPVSVELLLSSGEPGFNAECGIRVSGSTYTRSRYRLNSKFSFRLYFRRDYGTAKLKYPLIPDAPVGDLDRVVLRAGQSDSVNPFIKDELGRRLQRDMSGDACIGMFVNLFVNGNYRGYYNPCERIDEKMFQSRHTDTFAWDVVNQWRPEDEDYAWQSGDPVHRPYNFSVRDGDANSMNALLDYAITHDLDDPIHFEHMKHHLDIEWFVDYLILEGYLNHRDWPHNNWTAARERSDRDLGRWRFYAWDLEHCFYSSDVNRAFKVPSASGHRQPIGILYEQLKVSDRFRQLFADRVQKHFFNGGVLQAGHVVTRFHELRDTMAGELPNMNHSIADSWAVQRPLAVLSSLKNKGLFHFEGPRVLINGQPTTKQMLRSFDMITLETPQNTGTLWYTLDGSDPRVTAQPSEVISEPNGTIGDAPRGTIQYAYWLDLPGSRLSSLLDHPAYPSEPSGTQDLTQFVSPERWADHYGAQIQGYLYPPVTGYYTFWIACDDQGRLSLSKNHDPAQAVTIATVPSWTSSQEWDKHSSQQSKSLWLETGKRYYIQACYVEGGGGDHVAVAWQGPGFVRDVIKGQHLGPFDPNAVLPTQASHSVSPSAVAYDRQDIVPMESTTLKARMLDNGIWSGLSQVVFAVDVPLVINEVMTNNQTSIEDSDEPGDYPDWIELYNPTSNPIDLARFHITDDPNRPLLNPLSKGLVVEPHGFIILWADGAPEQGPTHLDFRLSRDGETLGLYDSETCLWIDRVDVLPLPADHTYRRLLDGQPNWIIANQPSPGYSNTNP